MNSGYAQLYLYDFTVVICYVHVPAGKKEEEFKCSIMTLVESKRRLKSKEDTACEDWRTEEEFKEDTYVVFNV